VSPAGSACSGRGRVATRRAARAGAGREPEKEGEPIMQMDDITRHDWNAGEEADSVSRSDVIIRIVYSLLFAVILGLVETLLLVIVVFQLLFSLVTQSMPTHRLQTFANQLVAFYYQSLRYLTHNDSLIPFPFSDLPEPLEPTRAAYAAVPDEDEESPDAGPDARASESA